MTDSSAAALGLQAIFASGVELSPPAELFVELAAGAADAVAGAAVETLTEDAIAQLPAGLTAAMGEALGSVAAAVPIVGEFVDFVGGVLSAVQQAEAARAEAAREKEQRARQVRPSGSLLGGCRECPADLFAPTIPGAETGVSWADGFMMRPLLGEALIAVTEGTEVDREPVWYCSELRRVQGPDRAGDDCEAALSTRAMARLRQIAKKVGDRVPPKAARETFRDVRRAIEASYRPRGDDAPSDGGNSLWPAYLDALLVQADGGNLSRTYQRYAVAGVWDGETLSLPEQYKALYYGYVEAIGHGPEPGKGSLLGQWIDTVRPRYAEGKAKLAELRAYLASSARRRVSVAVRRAVLARTRNAAIRAAVRDRPPPWRTYAVLGGAAALAAGAAGVVLFRERRPRP